MRPHPSSPHPTSTSFEVRPFLPVGRPLIPQEDSAFTVPVPCTLPFQKHRHAPFHRFDPARLLGHDVAQVVIRPDQMRQTFFQGVAVHLASFLQ